MTSQDTFPFWFHLKASSLVRHHHFKLTNINQLKKNENKKKNKKKRSDLPLFESRPINAIFRHKRL